MKDLTHGGVIKRENLAPWQTTALEERLISYKEEKDRIAAFVSQLIQDNESIMIDSGSTTLCVRSESIGPLSGCLPCMSGMDFFRGPQEGVIKQLMIMNARETIVAADSSKINNRALHLFNDYTGVSELVTGKNISKEAIAAIQKNGVKVFTV
jgi:DeoR/GlpR family transcriptional regulator of sugar metabolism